MKSAVLQAAITPAGPALFLRVRGKNQGAVRRQQENSKGKLHMEELTCGQKSKSVSTGRRTALTANHIEVGERGICDENERHNYQKKR